jgi:S1 RNA binding domain
LMPFLTFVQHHPVGTSVEAVVDHYSSHGAYVLIDDVVAYVPLRLMADPAPRSAREVMEVGQTVSLVVHSFTPGRRSIDLATPAMAPPPAEVAAPKARRSRAKGAVPVVPTSAAATVVTSEPVTKSKRGRSGAPKQDIEVLQVLSKASNTSKPPAKVKPVKALPVAAAPDKAKRSKVAPVKVAPVKVAPVKAAPVKVAPVKAAPVKAAPAKVNKPATSRPSKSAPVKAASTKLLPS